MTDGPVATDFSAADQFSGFEQSHGSSSHTTSHMPETSSLQSMDTDFGLRKSTRLKSRPPGGMTSI